MLNKELKLHVIGHKGVVGGATLNLLRRLGYKTSGNDKGEEIPRSADIYIICTQEDAVEQVVDEIFHSGNSPLVVIRSTCPIGTCKRLSGETGLHICHWPEHLREATALWDCYYPPFLSFGECCDEHGDWLHSLMSPMGVPIIRSDTDTSEATKYAINNIKAVIISFWNQFHDLGKKMGFNSHLAARIATHDYVVPQYGTILGGAYGGKCLPKDMQASIETFRQNEVSPDLLIAAEAINKRTKENHGESSIRTA